MPRYADVAAIRNSGVACHASTLAGADRSRAPADIDYHTVEAAQLSAEDGAAQVEVGSMPPRGSTTLTDAERQKFLLWARCGTPP